MKRRDFSLHLAGAGLGLAAAGRAQAQGGAPVEGKDYLRVQPAVQVTLPSAQKKIEVLEFFWYGCPHCFALEPLIQPWSRQLPADVYFHQVPFAFIGVPDQQKLFYALEALGQREALQGKIFDAIHVKKVHLNTESEITAFVAANGVNAAKFTEAFRSFSVDKLVNRGKQLSSDYKIDGVPAICVQGRYYTAASLAGTHERSLKVADFLIERARQGA